MAWICAARHAPALPSCCHRNCANCLTYATTWRHRIHATLTARCWQPSLFDPYPGTAVVA